MFKQDMQIDSGLLVRKVLFFADLLPAMKGEAWKKRKVPNFAPQSSWACATLSDSPVEFDQGSWFFLAGFFSSWNPVCSGEPLSVLVSRNFCEIHRHRYGYPASAHQLTKIRPNFPKCFLQESFSMPFYNRTFSIFCLVSSPVIEGFIAVRPIINLTQEEYAQELFLWLKSPRLLLTHYPLLNYKRCQSIQ